MAWATRGLRGSTLEEMINLTNETYRVKKLALIQKIPTPINPLKLNNADRTITLAYFEQKSTVDYIGVIQGVPVAFDAKETGRKSLPIQNIHAHQIDFMDDYERQGGLAFLIVHFNFYDEYYYLPFVVLKKYWLGSKAGKRKSIPYAAFEKDFLINSRKGHLLHYIEAVERHLERLRLNGETNKTN